MVNYEVSFRVGRSVVRVSVHARQSADAIVAAALKLDAEGVRNWSLVRVAEVMS